MIMVRGQQVLFDFIVLAQRHYSRREDMSLNSDTLSWFQANQSLLFLLNAACLVEKQHIQILVFGLTRPGLEQTIYCTLGEHAYYYAINGVDRQEDARHLY